MEIVNSSFHTIDIENNDVTCLDLQSDFSVFIEEYAYYASNNEKNKIYEIQNEDNLVFTSIKNIFHEQEIESCQRDIAKKLLECELLAQAKIFQTGTNVKKGSLLQALLKDGDKYLYFIAKVEHTKWYDGNDLSVQYGFPGDKKTVWKSAIIPFYEVNQVVFFDDLKVYSDTKAKYWTVSFLEVEEKRDDVSNTYKAYRAIDTELKSNLFEQAPQDYVKLSSDLLNTMNQVKDINYNSYVEEMMDTYEPSNHDIEKDVILDCLLSLPERKKFDTEFKTIPASIENKRTKRYLLSQGIELTIKSDAVDFSSKIVSTMKDGKRVIEIICDDDNTYEAFKE